MPASCVKVVTAQSAMILLAAIATVATPVYAQTVSISDADCARLVEHIPSADVAYTPGVDVRGRPVAPADLPGTPRITLPETITFDVSVDLRRFGLPRTSRLFEPNATVGKVTVESSGRAYFNGQPLQNTDSDALAQFCRQRTPKRR